MRLDSKPKASRETKIFGKPAVTTLCCTCLTASEPSFGSCSTLEAHLTTINLDFIHWLACDETVATAIARLHWQFDFDSRCFTRDAGNFGTLACWRLPRLQSPRM